MFMPRSVANTVDQIARKNLGKDWSLYAALLEHWQEIAGKAYADLATPVKITFPYQPQEKVRKGGTLTIRLPKGLAMEFSFKSEIIRQRINSYFGHEAIAKIALDPVFVKPKRPKKGSEALTPEAQKELEDQTESLENKELHDALYSFGEALIKKTAD